MRRELRVALVLQRQRNLTNNLLPKRLLKRGGVGKTASAAHIAVAAHNMGREVLLVDLAGTQNDLATHFGLSIVDEETKDDGISVDAPISAVFGDDWAFLRDNIDDLLDQMTFPTNEGPDPDQ